MSPHKPNEGSLNRWIRRIPINWRIPLVVVLNAGVALTVGLLGWQGANVVRADLNELQTVQLRSRQLTDIDGQASRLQSLIRQYLNSPTDELLKEITRRSDALFGALAAGDRPIKIFRDARTARRWLDAQPT